MAAIIEDEVQVVDTENSPFIPLDKKVSEILVDRLDKIEKTEVYASNNILLVMFPNRYSLSIEFRKSRKAACINVYKGIGNITPMYFPKGTNKKVVEEVFTTLLTHLEEKVD